jgi:hypothetical protein
VPAWPSHPGKPPAPDVEHLALARALTEAFPTDAHVQLTGRPDVPHRLKKEALARLEGGVPIPAFLVDVDAHELADAERELWFDGERVKVEALLAAHPGGFAYRTRGGYRIVFRLTGRVVRSGDDALAWATFYHRSLAYLARAFRIVGDPACSDWTRLFRLPHATRDKSLGPEDLEVIGDPHAIGPWTYEPDDLAADIATVRGLHDAFLASHPGTTTSPWGAVLKRLDPPPAPATMGPVAFVGGETKRARTALEREAASLASCPKGGRNPQCNTAAVKLGHYLASGELDETTIKHALFDAMQANGSVRDYGADACRTTIASGLEAGRKSLPATPSLERNPVLAECKRVREASGSSRERDKALFTAACRLFRRAGELNGTDVGAELLGAARVAGIGDEQATATIAKARTVVDRDREPEPGPEPDRDTPPEWLEDDAPEEPPPWLDDDSDAPELDAPDVEPGPEPEPAPPEESPPPRGKRLADVLPAGVDVDPGLVVPHGFALGTKLEHVVVKPARDKTCPECGEVCPVAKAECSQGHPLPEPPAQETRTTIARVPLWIGAELVRPEGNLWRLDGLVRKRLRRVVVERSLKHDARRLAQAVEGAGIPIVAGKRTPFDLAEYLDRFDACNTLPRKVARAQLGWDPGMTTFLLGTEPIGPAPLALHNPTAETLAGYFTTKGSAGEWRRTAEAMLQASPVAGLVLAASIASPMLRLFGWAPIGIVLGSLGGGNKSTLLRLAASVWGAHGDAASRQANGIVGNGNATLLALLGQFQALADLPHLVDELRAVVTDPRSRTELEGSLHQLIDGVERARIKRDGSGPRSIAQAPGCAIVATETDVSEFLTKGGAVRRFLPAPAPYASRPLGGLVPALAANHGHAGRAVLEGLVRTPKADRPALADLRERHLAQLREGTDPRSEALRTWSDQLAVALAAADVACRLCPAGMPDHDLWTSQLVACWEGLRAMGGTDWSHAADVVTRSYLEAVNWIGTMRAHLRPSPGRGQALDADSRRSEVRDPVIGRVYAAVHEGAEGEILRFVDVVAPALRDFLGAKGYSIGTLAGEWADRGWLVRHAGGKRTNRTINVKLGGVQVEVYRVALPGDGGES